MLNKQETDDGRKERKSPWPPAMCDEVWTGRVKLRAAMKEGMARYEQVKHMQHVLLDLGTIYVGPQFTYSASNLKGA